MTRRCVLFTHDLSVRRHAHRRRKSGRDFRGNRARGRGGAGKVDLDGLLDRRGPAAHDQNAVRPAERPRRCRGSRKGWSCALAARSAPDRSALKSREIVQGAEGLVHVNDLGIGGQGTRDLHSLPHTARQLPGIRPLEAGKADHLQVMPSRSSAAAGSFPLDAEGDVLPRPSARERCLLPGR